ncbi:hypothetical protein [Sphingomonas sp. 3-13AW]|uniref:hypothetical protein n=1 Tax=Sphingomonas sp. 3-13AW TaxID=3050450 RepID=UPI003BB733A3
MKPDLQTFSVDGAQVELTRIPVRRHDWDHRAPREGEPHGHPREQALYEIRIDGQHVGLAYRKHGFGRQWWNIDRLCPQYGHMAGMGRQTVTARGCVEDAKRLWDLAAVAREAVKLRREKTCESKPPKLATEDEIKAWVKLYRRQEAEEERASKERRAQWDREAAEQKRVAEERRLDVLGGLQSIDERFGGQLSNFEANALRVAIAAYAKA